MLTGESMLLSPVSIFTNSRVPLGGFRGLASPHIPTDIPAIFQDAIWQSRPKATGQVVPRHFPRNHLR